MRSNPFSLAPLLSRRSFLGGMAAQAGIAPFAVWVGSPSAFAQPVRERPEVSTAEGQRMIRVYRKAVGRMQDRARFPENHPHSWTFQSNIHVERPGTNRNQVFRPARNQTAAQVAGFRRMALGPPEANQVWTTCPHGTPHFLPWHRLFIGYFEGIISTVAGEAFALPYWDYTRADGRRLPTGFEAPRRGGSNPLHFAARTPEFLRSGLPARAVGANIVDSRRNLRAVDTLMNSRSLLGSANGGSFSEDLEYGIHGSVHTSLGTSGGMASPANAARDPIFWLHHCTIDWLWESWRNPGPDGTSPQRDPRNAWADQRYAFVDARVQHVTGLDPNRTIDSRTPRASYDRLFQVQGQPMALASGAEATPTQVLEGSGGGTIRGPGDSARIPMRPTVDPGVARGLAGQADRRWTLVLRVRAKSSAGIYVVYATKDGRQVEIGSFNLFTVEPHMRGHAGHGGSPVEIVRQIDVTASVQSGDIDPAAATSIVFDVRPTYLTEAVSVTVLSAQFIAR